MPAPLSILIAFGLIAGLAIVLRWTYGSDLAERRYRTVDDPAVAARAAHPSMMLDEVPDGRHDALDPAAAESVLADTDDEEFGLLRSVVIASDGRQAEIVRDVLRHAGIRATLAARPDGIRILVFAESLDQARRLLR